MHGAKVTVWTKPVCCHDTVFCFAPALHGLLGEDARFLFLLLLPLPSHRILVLAFLASPFGSTSITIFSPSGYISLGEWSESNDLSFMSIV